MTLNFSSVLLFLACVSQTTQAQYLSISSGYYNAQHGYLSDAASISTLSYGGKVDLTDWKRQQRGWFARGFAAQYIQGANYSNMSGKLPIYHWNQQQSIWFAASGQSQNMSIEVSSAQTLLSNSGNSTAITAGSRILAQHNINHIELYWHEATQYQSPINLIGLFYYSETSPASSTITSNSASIFDGHFNGFGLTMGRIKDHRGLNFQWRLILAELDMSFSDAVTNHRSVSKAESTAYKIGLDLNWHYRYYLAPYWYLVPQLKLGINSALQTQVDPSTIEYRPLIHLDSFTSISLQRRF